MILRGGTFLKSSKKHTVAQTDFLLLPLVSGVTWVTSQKAGVFPEDVA